MNKAKIKYILILIAGISLFVVAEMYMQTPIDWRKTYKKSDKIPYGTFVLFDALPDIFPKSEISVNNKSFYEYIQEKNNNDLVNYIIINDEIKLDDLSSDLFIDFVSKGNNLYLVANNFSANFSDTLHFTTDSWWIYERDDTTSTINLVNPKLRKKDGYLFVNKLYERYFDTFNKDNTKILGLAENNKANFIKIKLGKGNLFINLQALAYTNFHILNSDREYISNTLSYLPKRQIVWDEYYKGYKPESQTPMRYFLSRQALKFAFYLFMATLFLYLIFEFKRKQRYIPIINPPRNDSVNYVKTIGQLYFLKKDYKGIAAQKINFFLENIRNKYFIKTNVFDNNFYQLLSAKSNKEIDEIETLFNYISQIKLREQINEKELLELNRLIEEFNDNL